MKPFRILARIAIASLIAACGSETPEGSSAMTTAVATSPADTAQAVAEPPPNKAILDEVDRAGAWFHTKKTRAIWARRVEEDQVVKTLEGEEQMSAGDYLCRGESGDMWPQKDERLHAKYQATDTVDDDGWRLYEPNPDAEGVMAAQVAHPFTVEASWGTLSGKEGDFIVKNFEDRDVDYPDDVWIVDQALFLATYARVGAEPASESDG